MMSPMTEKRSFSQSMTANQRPVPSKLWYKNYMVWIFVIGLPLVVVLTCIWFVFYSIQIKDSVVRDDWYMDGKTLYADVSKDKLAHDLDLTGAMTIRDNVVNFILNVPQAAKFSQPNELKVQISHATQVQKDRDFVMTKQADGHYQGKVDLDPAKGKYYIIVHDTPNTWRLRTSTELPSAKSLIFKPLAAFDE